MIEDKETAKTECGCSWKQSTIGSPCILDCFPILLRGGLQLVAGLTLAQRNDQTERTNQDASTHIATAEEAPRRTDAAARGGMGGTTAEIRANGS